MTKRDSVALWRALREQKIEDEIAELDAMDDATLDAHVRTLGGDPEKLRAEGAALAEELFARRERLGWQRDAAKKLEAFRALAEAMKTKEKLPRAELLARLETARRDPRFSAPVTALFHDKQPEASTDEELQALLDQVLLLAKLDDEDP